MPTCLPATGVPTDGTTESQGMEWMSTEARASNWDCMLFNLNPLNRRPGHTHTHTCAAAGTPPYWFSVSSIQSSTREKEGVLPTTTNQPHWSTMNTTIHTMTGAIGSGGGWWLLTVALAYGGEGTVVKMVSGSSGGG
jgi:hypothetical protein